MSVCGLPRWLNGKESTCNAEVTGDVGSIPGSGRSPWRTKWQPTPLDRVGSMGQQKCQTELSNWTATTTECLLNARHCVKHFYTDHPIKPSEQPREAPIIIPSYQMRILRLNKRGITYLSLSHKQQSTESSPSLSGALKYFALHLILTPHPPTVMLEKTFFFFF